MIVALIPFYVCTHCDWLGTLDEAADDLSCGPAATLCPDCFSHIEPADQADDDQPVSLARSGALPRRPEASGVVSDVVQREAAGEGAPALSPRVSEGTASAQRINGGRS